MNTFRRSGISVPLLSALAVFSLSAQAQEPGRPEHGRPAVQAARPGPGPARPMPGRAAGPHDARFARGALPARNFGGHAYHGHLAWEGGRWRHEVHNGRNGWWWDVGGAWYFSRKRWKDRPPTSPTSSLWTIRAVPMARPLPEAILRPRLLTRRRRRHHRRWRQTRPLALSEALSWAEYSAVSLHAGPVVPCWARLPAERSVRSSVPRRRGGPDTSGRNRADAIIAIRRDNTPRSTPAIAGDAKRGACSVRLRVTQQPSRSRWPVVHRFS